MPKASLYIFIGRYMCMKSNGISSETIKIRLDYRSGNLVDNFFES